MKWKKGDKFILKENCGTASGDIGEFIKIDFYGKVIGILNQSGEFPHPRSLAHSVEIFNLHVRKLTKLDKALK